MKTITDIGWLSTHKWGVRGFTRDGKATYNGFQFPPPGEWIDYPKRGSEFERGAGFHLLIPEANGCGFRSCTSIELVEYSGEAIVINSDKAKFRRLRRVRCIAAVLDKALRRCGIQVIRDESGVVSSGLAVAFGSATAVVNEGDCRAYGEATVKVNGGKCWAYDSVMVKQSGGECSAYDSATVMVAGGYCWAYDSATVKQAGGKCMAWNSAMVKQSGGGCMAFGSAMVEQTGGDCRAYDSATVELSGGKCRAYNSAKIVQTGGEK